MSPSSPASETVELTSGSSPPPFSVKPSVFPLRSSTDCTSEFSSSVTIRKMFCSWLHATARMLGSLLAATITLSPAAHP
jgi:hypothetical protein